MVCYSELPGLPGSAVNVNFPVVVVVVLYVFFVNNNHSRFFVTLIYIVANT